MSHSLVGIWRLTATRARALDGTDADPPYGPTPMGLLTFTVDGRMACVLVDGRMGEPVGIERDYVSYAGTYRVDGPTLTTRVEHSSDRSRLGGDEVRAVTFADRDRLTLSPPPRRRGRQVVAIELDWERVSAAADGPTATRH